MSDPKIVQIGIPSDLPITLTFVPEAPAIRTLPTCTRQQFINALAKAGRSIGYSDNWWEWLAMRADLNYLLLDRGKVYDGPPLEELNWSAKELAAVKLALGV